MRGLTALRSREAGLVVAAVVLAVATRNWLVGPSLGLDSSWAMALHYWSRGAAHGQPVEFTYGPLGFLSVPANWARLTAMFAVAFTVLVRAALAYLLLRLLLARRLLFSGLVPLWLVLVAVDAGGPAQTLEWLAFAWAVFRWGRGIVGGPRLLVAEGIGLGLVGLVKPGSALVVVVVLVVVNLGLGAGGWRVRALRSLVLLGTAAVAFVSGWVLSGQPLAQLGPWLHASVSLVGGYGAMAYDEPGRGWEYSWAFAGMAAAAVLWWLCSEYRRWALLLLSSFLYLEFKHGFVRHDAAHSPGLFLAVLTAVMVVPVAVAGLPAWVRNVQVVLVHLLALLVLAVLPEPRGGSLPAPGAALGSFVREVGTLADGGTWQRNRRETQASMREAYALDGPARAALQGGVQVDPWDTSVVYAYDLRWHPVPIFQTYSSYTPWLDERNAKALAADNAPDRILRSRENLSIDGRYGLFESPRYQYEEECRYHEVVASGDWQVLAPGPSRCGSSFTLGTRQDVANRAVDIPEPVVPGDAVVARVALGASWTDHLLDLLLKSPDRPVVCLDEHCYLFVPGTAQGPLLVRKATWMPRGPGRDADVQHTTIRLLDVPAGADVEFFEVTST